MHRQKKNYPSYVPRTVSSSKLIPKSTPNGSPVGVTARDLISFYPRRIEGMKRSDRTWIQKPKLWISSVSSPTCNAIWYQSNPSGSVIILGWILHCQSHVHRPNDSTLDEEIHYCEFLNCFGLPPKYPFYFLCDSKMFVKNHYDRTSAVTSQIKCQVSKISCTK